MNFIAKNGWNKNNVLEFEIGFNSGELHGIGRESGVCKRQVMFMGISMSGVENIAKAGFSALMNSALHTLPDKPLDGGVRTLGGGEKKISRHC